MKLWLSKNSEIPIKDQIIAQVRVGVAAGDLKSGERLPSTRDISRRFGIHPNTVSAAYRELARSGEVSKKYGSGVFICEATPGNALDRLIDGLAKDAAAIGYSMEEVVAHLLRRIGPPNTSAGFTLFEPNEELAEIIVREVSNATGLAVLPVGPGGLSAALASGLRLIALADERAKLEKMISDVSVCTFLTANSAALSMTGQARPSSDDIVAIASAWDDFLNFARLFLIAAGVDADSIVQVSTKEIGWESKIRAATVIICDSLVGSGLSCDSRVRVFRLLSQASLDLLSMRTPSESVLAASTTGPSTSSI